MNSCHYFFLVLVSNFCEWDSRKRNRHGHTWCISFPARLVSSYLSFRGIVVRPIIFFMTTFLSSILYPTDGENDDDDGRTFADLGVLKRFYCHRVIRLDRLKHFVPVWHFLYAHLSDPSSFSEKKEKSKTCRFGRHRISQKCFLELVPPVLDLYTFRVARQRV